MSSLVEVAANLVVAQAYTTPMSIDQILSEISKLHKGLNDIASGKSANAVEAVNTTISYKDAFLKNEVICMVCGKGGFKTLGLHLTTAHDMKPSDYRKQFGIPRSQSLTAKSYSQARRKSALDRGLADNLAKARAARQKNVEAPQAAVTGDEGNVAEVAVAVGS